MMNENHPAATPVTVEAPKGEKWVEVPESEMQKARKHISALLVGIWPEDGFDTVEDVQAELKKLRATPKPIGDVPKLKEFVQALLSKLAGLTDEQLSNIDETITCSLSPFFAPAGPENKEQK